MLFDTMGLLVGVWFVLGASVVPYFGYWREFPRGCFGFGLISCGCLLGLLF